MKKIKYLLALCLILAAASAFAACGNNSNVADTSMVENTQRGGSATDDAGNAGKDIIDGAGNAGKDVIDGLYSSHLENKKTCCLHASMTHQLFCSQWF